MSKKILVLGATGTVGKPLVEGLLAKGEAVKAASRANRKMDGVESTPFDFGKPETIATAWRVWIALTCSCPPAT